MNHKRAPGAIRQIRTVGKKFSWEAAIKLFDTMVTGFCGQNHTQDFELIQMIFYKCLLRLLKKLEKLL